MTTHTKTTCPYCGVGCGVIATVDDRGAVSVAGDPDHPANFGRLCSKGSALAETLSLDDRLLSPMIDGQSVGWDDALDLVASRFSETIIEHGPDSVAFYVSGQFLTEDYYVANKLMKGFIGSANIDTNSRLCMSSSVAGHKRAFGSDTVPGSYKDLETADLVVLVGSNLAWCHPVLFQRLSAARDTRGTRIVVIDPRRTATCEIADLHLGIAPDSDVALFGGLLGYLFDACKVDENYVEAHTSGLDEALDAVSDMSISRTAAATGVTALEVETFFQMFAETEKVVTVYSQGVNQSISGTDKVNAIINCHLITGRIGREGMGPLSATGQPNAMGGREVGGMATMLAAHMSLESPHDRDLVQTFWASPTIADTPGLMAVDMFQAVADGRVKAIWIMATNPVDSLPDADAVKRALSLCPFVVVSEVIARTDTSAFAHVLLPAAGWGEKSGTVTNSERRISRQRAFLDVPGEARPDWWIMAEVARRMGHQEGFDFADAADVFREHAALSGFRNDGTARAFDIGAWGNVTPERYDAMAPFQWPAPKSGRGRLAGDASARDPGNDVRFFANGGFHTPDRLARFVAVSPQTVAKTVTSAHPFVLNTGRIRDQWHTMTRTGKTARLSSHFAESFCEIHPDDATSLGIAAADLVRVSNDRGEVILRALVTDRQRRGSLFAPIHWTDQFAGTARVDALVDPETDPYSGQPGSKFTAVAAERFAADWYGFALTMHEPDTNGLAYWTRAKSAGGNRLELAGHGTLDDVEAMARQVLGLGNDIDCVAYHDRDARVHRLAAFDGERLVGAIFISPDPVQVSRDWLAGHLAADMAPRDRLRLLAGRGGKDSPDPGATVCSCFSIGINQIIAAIETGVATTIAEVGDCLKAGTNCGSCRSEIGRILRITSVQVAAE
jgi:assimilatory nitrate reductase catalytic subunit